jgi:Adenosine deaminase
LAPTGRSRHQIRRSDLPVARDLRALPKAARHGVGFGVTIAATRHRGPDHAEGLARFAAAYAGEGVYALGLTGDERAFPPGPFARALVIATATAGIDAWLSRDGRRDEFSGSRSRA